MPRLFTGLRVTPEISNALAMKRGGLVGARWIEPENYHITIGFAGDMDHGSAHELMRALDDMPSLPPFSISIAGLDAFGGDKPRAIIAHVEGGDELRQLKGLSDAAMRRAQVNFDRRRFTPHVTLARLRHASALDVADYLGSAVLMPMRMQVEELVLFSSRDSRGGGPYRTEQTIELYDQYEELAY
ncbi:MAG: RNA 2',3'-cyclic phosphodiesterase [Hyphomicrobiaceae bacterium]|nr:RNA 2',3'-cyclic phosphodiesterase [Hyphomicrobiaceae bacterium]MCC0023768.1 RNA 2',3'-cyclic phosphodiesterase [Hyphomicrobiaceae bacterium]